MARACCPEERRERREKREKPERDGGKRVKRGGGCGERNREKRDDRHGGSIMPRCSSLVGLWTSRLPSLSLSFLDCKMGLIT